MDTTLAKTNFANDLEEGLLSEKKTIPSRYFYDDRGDELFQQIMATPSYYLTTSELEIFSQQTDALIETLLPHDQEFDIIELGAGDGAKTKFLLTRLTEHKRSFRYIPIDISEHALQSLEQNLQKTLPNLEWNGIQGDYFDALHTLTDENRPKIILFLGSTIGNFTTKESIQFLSKIARNMNDNDMLLVGFDLKKDPRIILQAYDDPQGFTREFNLNLLRRINSELEGNFNLDKFLHVPVYDPLSGQALSYLVSTEEQEIQIKGSGLVMHLDAWETIHTETSQKYDLTMIMNLATKSDLIMLQVFTDSKNYFMDVVFKKK